MLPSLARLRRRRKVRVVSLRGPGVDPSLDRVYFPLAEAPVVAKLQAYLRIGRQWWHFARHDLLLDQRSARPHHIVGSQRYPGGEFISLMTFHAVLEQNKRYVMGKRGN